MYWMACKVLTESKRQEEKYEAECRKVCSLGHPVVWSGVLTRRTQDRTLADAICNRD